MVKLLILHYRNLIYDKPQKKFGGGKKKKKKSQHTQSNMVAFLLLPYTRSHLPLLTMPFSFLCMSDARACEDGLAALLLC